MAGVVYYIYIWKGHILLFYDSNVLHKISINPATCNLLFNEKAREKTHKHSMRMRKNSCHDVALRQVAVLQYICHRNHGLACMVAENDGQVGRHRKVPWSHPKTWTNQRRPTKLNFWLLSHSPRRPDHSRGAYTSVTCTGRHWKNYFVAFWIWCCDNQ